MNWLYRCLHIHPPPHSPSKWLIGFRVIVKLHLAAGYVCCVVKQISIFSVYLQYFYLKEVGLTRSVTSRQKNKYFSWSKNVKCDLSYSRSKQLKTWTPLLIFILHLYFVLLAYYLFLWQFKVSVFLSMVRHRLQPIIDFSHLFPCRSSKHGQLGKCFVGTALASPV